MKFGMHTYRPNEFEFLLKKNYNRTSVNATNDQATGLLSDYWYVMKVASTITDSVNQIQIGSDVLYFRGGKRIKMHYLYPKNLRTSSAYIGDDQSEFLLLAFVHHSLTGRV